MSERPIIEVQGLSKRYYLGASGRQNERYTALRDVMAEKARSLFRRGGNRAGGATPEPRDDFWALRDVSFSVGRGEVVGIIGRNGAGKSTLLKILSRITEPTAGKIALRGRVASLLEVGTGFHPELTGRENIFLNGAILGMRRGEISAKFDEIVAFAEVERFLDTPVKRYSSGMYVRLAFAVAAHLEPEILIVDEVLAVGDTEFQKKCLGKMQQVAKGEGRTVLFVSHNMRAITQLCGRGLLLTSGMVTLDGSAVDATNKYLIAAKSTPAPGRRDLIDELVLKSLEISPHSVPSGDPITIEVEMEAKADAVLHEFVILLYTQSGMRLAIIDCRDEAWPLRVTQPSAIRITARLPTLPLVEGEYTIGLYLATMSGSRDRLELAEFTVAPPDAGARPSLYGIEHLGYVHLSPEIVCCTLPYARFSQASP